MDFIKMSFTCLTKEVFLPIYIYSALVGPHLEYAIQANCPYLKNDIYHLERMRRGRNEVGEGLRDLNYEERLKALKLHYLVKRRIRNYSVQTEKIMYSQIALQATQLLKFSRRPGLRSSSCKVYTYTYVSNPKNENEECSSVYRNSFFKNLQFVQYNGNVLNLLIKASFSVLIPDAEFKASELEGPPIVMALVGGVPLQVRHLLLSGVFQGSRHGWGYSLRTE